MLNIVIDASDLMSVNGDMQATVLALQQGIVDAGAFIRDTWVQAVSGDRLPGMTRSIQDDRYASAIKMMDQLEGNALSVIIAPFGYRKAEEIEDGKPAWDMKPMLLGGPKARPTKDGEGKYNIIPFRHYVPKPASAGNSAIAIRARMPQNIYEQAKQLARSIPNQSTGRIQWGEHLNIDGPLGRNKTSGYIHKNNIYDAMYRVGYEKHSQYVAFRTVSTPRVGKNGKRKGSDPDSWIHPPTPANPIMQAVYNYCMPRVEENLNELIRTLFT